MSNVAGLFLAYFAKIITVTGIFKDFTKVLSNFLFYSRFLEDLSMANSVSFKKSFQKLKPTALGKELSTELT